MRKAEPTRGKWTRWVCTLAIDKRVVPEYFSGIAGRLQVLRENRIDSESAQSRQLTQAVLPVGGGTDIYVQRPDAMAGAAAEHVFYEDAFRGIRGAGEFIEMGASTTVTDLLESRVMQVRLSRSLQAPETCLVNADQKHGNAGREFRERFTHRRYDCVVSGARC